MTIPMEQYGYWRNALAGRDQPTHPSEPHAGFWYKRQKSGPRLPVATWWNASGELIAKVGFADAPQMGDPLELWTWICASPVPEADYRAAYEAGIWPDDPPPVARGSVLGDNLSDDPAEAIRAELQGEIETTKPFLAKKIDTKADADRAATWAKRVGDLAKRADDARKSEKAPHLAKTREVDGKWNEIVEAAADLAKALKKHLEPYLIAQARAEEQKQREAEAEAARLREEAAKAFELGSPNAESIGRALAQHADTIEQAAAAPPRNASAGRTGAKVALRKEKTAKIVDYDACYQALKTHPDMKALVEQLANRAVRAGVPLAGVEVETTEKAA